LNSKPSKSARKREYLALQALGEQLIGLSREQLESLPLDERLSDAVLVAQSMRAHGALRRQKQLIGKLMRGVDPAPIRLALHAFGHSDQLDKRVFSDAEKWRDRITADEPNALVDFFTHLGHENQALVAEVKALAAATSDRARKQAKRRVFREIHKEIMLKVQNEARCI